jgi:hypothetical protein
LEDDAEAHQKYQESLPLKKEAQILEDNAAAHQKYWEFLPPKEKAQILEDNAAAHQKHHQHHLIEEEKKTAAQIMKYAATLHNMIHLDQATVKFLQDNFFKDPTLALAYYHCCSINPHAAIFNVELGSNVDKSTMWHHILNLIGDPIGQKEAVACQQTFRCLDQLHAEIAACASCCKCLLSSDHGQEGIVEMNINALPSTFLLANMQIQRLTTLPCYIVENHIQVVQHNGHFYHLNPDLVFDVNKIVLCPVCVKDPMT